MNIYEKHQEKAGGKGARPFPLHMILSGRSVLVVGGGGVASRRVRSLLEAGASVTVIAPEADDHLRSRAEAGEITLLPRQFRRGDTASFFLCLAATNDPAVNREVIEDARAEGVLVSSADDPQSGDFVVPAVHRDGELVVSVGCGGVPTLATAVRDRISRALGGGWRERIEVMKQVRQKLLTHSLDHAYNKKILRRISVDLCHVDDDCTPDAVAERVRRTLESAVISSGTVTSSEGDQ